MGKFVKNRIFWQILILWSAWALITFSLTNGLENIGRYLSRIVPILIGYIIIITINVKYLLPKFYMQRQHVLYILWSILLLAATAIFLYHTIFHWSDWFHLFDSVSRENMDDVMPRKKGPKWMLEVTPLIVALLGSTILEITRFSTIREKEKMAAELKFLKSQVNPHFLFNALNNIYSLSVVQAPQAPESIMQLSEILRYMVYDSNEEKVPLKNEIKYIKNFVELQLLKDSRGMNVTIDMDNNSPNVMVAPLLFIPFVENAFKHSRIEDLKDGFIKIQLTTDNQTIMFNVLNSVPKNNFKKDEVGGVGLENTKKRLQLLYPNNQHELIIRQMNNQFEVNLKIMV